MLTVSVVVPVHNGAERLEATMASLLAQTEGPLELIVVDDGSTDATPRLLADMAARDRRLRVLRQPNGGITQALVRGCAAATGDLIARQDCGDISRPERLRRQRDIFERETDAVLTSCGTRYLGPQGEFLFDRFGDGDAIRASLLHDDIGAIRGLSHHGTAMFRRSTYIEVGGYRAQMYFAQDVDLWIRLAQRGRIVFANEILYEASLDTGSISSRHRPDQVQLAEIAICLREDGLSAQQRETLLRVAAGVRPRPRAGRRRAEANALHFLASCLRRNGDPRWRRYAKAALRCRPWQVTTWSLWLRGPR